MQSIRPAILAVPVGALVFSSVVGNVAAALDARDAPPAEAIRVLRITELSLAGAFVAGAAMHGQLVPALVLAGILVWFYDRYVL